MALKRALFGAGHDADLLDAGMIFGTGFAPFLGGPMQYAKSRGIKTVIARLEGFAKQHGERFKPNAGWQVFLNHGYENMRAMQEAELN